MAAKRQPFNFEALVGMIPIVMDFLDIDSEDVIASGILDDDKFDDAVISMILSHRKRRKESSARNSVSDATGDSTTIPQQHTLHSPQCGDPMNESKGFQADTFRSRFRMSRAMFDKLLKDVTALTSLEKRDLEEESCEDETERIQQDTSLPIPLGVLLMLTLRYLGSKEPIDHLAIAENISQYKIMRILHTILDALCQDLMQHYIRWPDPKEMGKCSEVFKVKCGLDGVLGTIDALHIPAKVPADHVNYYTNKHGETTILLQTVCDYKLRFLDCSAGWPGSMTKVSAFKDSDLHNNICMHKDTYFSSPDQYLIGEEGYPLTEWLMTPFKNNGGLKNIQVNFNTACKVALQNNTVAYRLLMQRFPRLECLGMGPSDSRNAVTTILACCMLHNFCIANEDFALFDDAEVKIRNDCLSSTPDVDSDFCVGNKTAEQKRNNLSLFAPFFTENVTISKLP